MVRSHGMLRAVVHFATDGQPDESLISLNTLGPIFFAASLTFLAAVLLQALVVPLVQARTRRIELWEDAVSELASLVEEKIPRAMSELENAVRTEFIMYAIAGQAEIGGAKVKERLASAAEKRRYATDIVSRHVARTKLLVAKAARRRKRAPFWTRLRVSQMGLDIDTTSIDVFSTHPEYLALDNDEWEPAFSVGWQRYEDSLARITHDVRMLEERMKPPPRRPLWRVLRAIRKSPARFKAWRVSFKKDDPDTPEDSANQRG